MKGKDGKVSAKKQRSVTFKDPVSSELNSQINVDITTTVVFRFWALGLVIIMGLGFLFGASAVCLIMTMYCGGGIGRLDGWYCYIIEHGFCPATNILIYIGRIKV